MHFDASFASAFPAACSDARAIRKNRIFRTMEIMPFDWERKLAVAFWQTQ